MNPSMAHHPAPLPLDERLNTLSHGLGVLLSVLGTVVLLVAAIPGGDPWKITGVAIFGGSLFVLYMVSTLYHASRDRLWKQRYKMLDHCAIFVLIAGSYTPFLLVNMRDNSGALLLVAIWSLALAGIALKSVFRERYRLARVGVYLLMGWLILFAMGDFLSSVNTTGVVLLIAGGAAYTLGIIFYLAHRLPFHHTIWHMFVLAGSILHYFAVLLAVLPHGVAG